MTYITTKLNVSENQVVKIKNAMQNSKGVTIQFSIEDLRCNNPTHTLALTKMQLNKLAKALDEGVGARITMSKTQLQHNKTIASQAANETSGGLIAPALVAGLATSVIPSLASFIMDKITGKGIFVKRGANLFKLRLLGDGLYLRPYNASRVGEITTGDGLYFKTSGSASSTGSSYELIKNGSINDIPILNKL